jgi:hypothetical protein
MKYLFILENALIEELLQFLVAIVYAELFKTNKQNLLSGCIVTFLVNIHFYRRRKKSYFFALQNFYAYSFLRYIYIVLQR